MAVKDVETIYPASRQEWREWLEKNHREKSGVWVVQYNKKSGKPTITWSEAVDEALCFGWIDSIKKKVDEESTVQFFSKRKAKSTWSKINKEKTVRLIENGLMAEAGIESIEIAKQNGSWTLLDEVEALKIPPDLEEALLAHEGAKDYFDSLSKSTKKAILQWLILAGRPETRLRRLNEIATLAGKRQKPKQF